MSDNPNPAYPRWSSVSGDIEPPNGAKDIGFEEGYRPPAQWFNWLLKKCYEWLVYLNTIMVGTLFHTEYVHCNTLVSPGTNWTFSIGPIRVAWWGGSVTLAQDAQTVTLSSTLVDPADLKTGTGPVYALYPGATYYLYMYRDSGTGNLAFNVSRTVPTLSGGVGWKTGFVGTHRYLCSFKTTTESPGGAFAAVQPVGVPLPFVKERNRYTYLWDNTTVSHLTTPAETVAGDRTISLANWVPDGVLCRVVRVLYDYDYDAASAELFKVHGVVVCYLPSGPTRAVGFLEAPINTTRQIVAGFQNGGGSSSFNLVVLGYDEGMQ